MSCQCPGLSASLSSHRAEDTDGYDAPLCTLCFSHLVVIRIVELRTASRSLAMQPFLWLGPIPMLDSILSLPLPQSLGGGESRRRAPLHLKQRTLQAVLKPTTDRPRHRQGAMCASKLHHEQSSRKRSNEMLNHLEPLPFAYWCDKKTSPAPQADTHGRVPCKSPTAQQHIQKLHLLATTCCHFQQARPDQQ